MLRTGDKRGGGQRTLWDTYERKTLRAHKEATLKKLKEQETWFACRRLGPNRIGRDTDRLVAATPNGKQLTPYVPSVGMAHQILPTGKFESSDDRR